MTHRQNSGLVLLIALWLPHVGIRAAQPGAEQPGAEQPSAKEIQTAFAKAAEDYVLLRDGSETSLKLHKTPLLKWSNPERSEQQGLVFVWHESGMPMAIGSFFTFEHRGLRAKHEFHSLSDTPLSATYRKQTAWTPSDPGVTWKPFTDLGSPHNSKGLRLSQMKQIAGSFDVTLVDPEGDRSKLRLLRTPLHRFSAPAKGVTDGAIFSYTVATDPEAMLLVCAKGDRWEYALARFHYWRLEARLKGVRVWSATLDQGMEGNRLGDQPQMTKVYNSFYPESDYLFRP